MKGKFKLNHLIVHLILLVGVIVVVIFHLHGNDPDMHLKHPVRR